MTELNRLVADEKATAAIRDAKSPAELAEILSHLVQKSGIADRDDVTGQYIVRQPQTAAATTTATTTAPAEKKDPVIVTKTEVIGGKTFTFTGTDAADVANQITNAYRVAEAVATSTTQARSEQQAILDKAEAELALRRGEITAAEFLERTNAIETYLLERGFDLNAASAKQYEQSWAEATEAFLQSEAGADWPGGARNLNAIGLQIQALGLTEAKDKVAALTQAYAEMKSKGMVFDGDYTPEQVLESMDHGVDATGHKREATPQEILEAWKQTHADPAAANAAFIEAHGGTGGYGSGVFGK
jgi:hypothetical protein